MDAMSENGERACFEIYDTVENSNATRKQDGCSSRNEFFARARLARLKISNMKRLQQIRGVGGGPQPISP